MNKDKPRINATLLQKIGPELMCQAACGEILILSPREQKVIRMRLGYTKGGIVYTLAEIGKELGLSESRIHQIVSKALRRIEYYSKHYVIPPNCKIK
jgi:DNA-directed RNA polymerase sigma subunit (sigma70/sigma32)